MEPLYEGKAKKVLASDQPDEVLMVYKDDATAFNGEKLEQFEGKGHINKTITVLLYEILEREGIATHYVGDVDDVTVRAKKVDIIPIEYVVRNIAAGSLAKRTGYDEGHPLSRPVVEFYYKNDDLGDPMINADHVAEMDLATPPELEELHRVALKINEILQHLFLEAGIRLVDFKLEFGRVPSEENRIVLADEITPDTCRLWDVKTGEKMDKDRFRRDLGDLMAYYRDVLKRLISALQ